MGGVALVATAKEKSTHLKRYDTDPNNSISISSAPTIGLESGSGSAHHHSSPTLSSFASSFQTQTQSKRRTTSSFTTVIFETTSQFINNLSPSGNLTDSSQKMNGSSHPQPLSRLFQGEIERFHRDTLLQQQFIAFLQNEWLQHTDLLKISLQNARPLPTVPLPPPSRHPSSPNEGDEKEDEEEAEMEEAEGEKHANELHSEVTTIPPVMEEIIHVSMKEYIQQILFTFIFQSLERVDGQGEMLPTEDIALPNSPNGRSSRKNFENLSVYETVFADYQIDLSEEAHKKASLLAQLRYRRAMSENNLLNNNHNGAKNTRHSRHHLNGRHSIEEDWQHPILSFEVCRDFLIIFMWSVYQSMDVTGTFHLTLPQVPLTDPQSSKKGEDTERGSKKEVKERSDGPPRSTSPSTDLANSSSKPSTSFKQFVNSESHASQQIHHKRYQALTTLYNTVHQHVSKQNTEFIHFVTTQTWWKASTFFNYLDHLPVALAISAVPEKTPNDRNIGGGEAAAVPFPFIYVNHYCETMTLFSQQEMIGKSWNCFHSSVKTEKNQIRKMERAMQSGKGIKVGIMNQRKDQSYFFNFHAIIPIYDRHGKYHYILHKFDDVSNPKTTLKTLQFSEEVMYWVGLILHRL